MTADTVKARHLSAAELIDVVLDAGSFESWDNPIDDPEPDAAYRADLEKARTRSGVD